MWIELHINTDAAHATALGDQLMLLGALAVTYQDAGDNPIYEPQPTDIILWEQTIVIGLFDADFPIPTIFQYLEQQQSTGQIHSFHLKKLPDQDWQRICLEQFKPMQFGSKLWVCPSWHQPPEPNGVNITLDPGLAFGTGTHPTTALCLNWLAQHVQQEGLVIDYGCGSGILALAALKLGAKQVVAIDNDPQALEATQQNAVKNHISSQQLIMQLPDKLIADKADLLIANILAQPLISLASHFATLTKSNSKILLSGILAEQQNLIETAYNPWFTFNVIEQQNEWICLAGIRN